MPHPITRLLALVVVTLVFGCSPGTSGGVSGGDRGRRDHADGGARDSTERCDNGVDDNGDGLVDEGCACDPGPTQACWPGPPGLRDKGACHDGIQRCEPYGEFYAWGPCESPFLPAPELGGNCVDEDCDGLSPGCAGCSSELPEVCDNGADDDCDALVDCADDTCASAPTCGSTCAPSEAGACGDSLDNDCDRTMDCADPDCAGAAECAPEACTPESAAVAPALCTDGHDNDCDGLVDCADPECHVLGACGCVAEVCGNGTDDDCDGVADCDDTDCQRCVPGGRRWCDDPVYCNWGEQTCGPDGRWGACTEVPDNPPGCDPWDPFGFDRSYDTACCVSSGACCQDYPASRSVGNCAGISLCSS